jgi:hypothetical protein
MGHQRAHPPELISPSSAAMLCPVIILSLLTLLVATEADHSE